MTTRRPLRRAVPGVVAIVLAVPAALAASAPAQAESDSCVGPGSGCYRTLQAAVDAAKPGATIRIRPGTYRGLTTITKSLTIRGAGAERTRLKGAGDRVLRILSPTTATPTITISGLTVTGGVAHGDQDKFAAFGGGMIIDQVGAANGNGTPGAHVTLDHVVVAGNRAEPITTTTDIPGGQNCVTGKCPFAISSGGGIANLGFLTLKHSVVRDNRSGGVGSDADGAGISSYFGTLTVDDSTITHNVAAPRRIGRFAEGAGIFVGVGPSLRVHESSISGNTVLLDTRWPVKGQDGFVEMIANSAGIHVSDGVDTTIEGSRIDDNVVSVVDPVGAPSGCDSAMLVGNSHLTMRHTEMRGNRVTVVAANSDPGPSGTVLELNSSADISDSSIVDNDAVVTGVSGSATVSNGLAVLAFNGPQQANLTRVRIAENTATAKAPKGDAPAIGGGVLNVGALTLDHSAVDRNRAVATGGNPLVNGGGILNSVTFDLPAPKLVLTHSRVRGNVASATKAEGGGIWTTVPITLQGSSISGNRPDQCAGGGCPGSASSSVKASAASAPSALHATARTSRDAGTAYLIG